MSETKNSMLLEFPRCPITKSETHEELGYNSDHPPSLYVPPTQEERRQFYHDLDLDNFSAKGDDVPREQAKKAYAELNAWNRGEYNHMVELLEPLFLEHIERAANFIVSHPHEIRKMAEKISTHQVPYKFAGLPPNLFDHLPSHEPFLPQTKQGVIDLINNFQTYNERLRNLRKWDVICNGKEQPYRDIALELLRKQRSNPNLFATPADQQEWHSYSQSYRDSELDHNRPTFYQNVTAVNYVDNRRYSEMSGFFEKTDGAFDAFFLANFYPSRRAVTSQVRVPFMHGYEAPAEELLKSIHVLMQLLKSDKQLAQEASWKLASHKDFLNAHLTRNQGLELEPSLIDNGVYESLIEGTQVVGAVFAECEADGIPGFESDYWGGLNAMLDNDVAVKLAANVPPAVIMPPTLHGNRFEHILIRSKNGLIVRPDVALKFQQMLDRQTVAIHAQWSRYHQRPDLRDQNERPPVRFGLRCPFKNNAVRQIAETLMLCRAAIH